VFIESKTDVALHTKDSFELVALLVFTPGGDLRARLGVTGAAERIEDSKDNAPQQKHRRHRPHQDTDGEDGRRPLRRGIRQVAASVQDEQGQGDGDGGCDFLE